MKKIFKDIFCEPNGKISLARITFFMLMIVVFKSLIINEKIVNESTVSVIISGLIMYIFSNKTKLNKTVKKSEWENNG